MGSLADAAAATAAAATADTCPEVTADASSSQPRSYAAAAASTTTTTQSARPVITDDGDQSGSAQKASSAPQGTKRRLVMPDYEMGLSYHRVDDWASVMRPPPQVNNQHVVFASFKDAKVLPKARDVVAAAYAQFGHKLVALDVFPASLQYALAFCLSKQADEAATAGLHMGDGTVVPLVRRPQHRPTPERVTVAGVDCTNPGLAARHLYGYFSNFGRVLDVAPRVWEGTLVLTGTWHVTIDTATRTEKTIRTPPPPVATIGGVEVFIDIPKIRRTCRVCHSVEHTNPACRIGQALARQGRLKQQKDQQQQQQHDKEQQQQAKAGPRRWCDQLRQQPQAQGPKASAPAPKKALHPQKEKDATTTTKTKPTKTPAKSQDAGKGKEKGKAKDIGSKSPLPSRSNTPPPKDTTQDPPVREDPQDREDPEEDAESMETGSSDNDWELDGRYLRYSEDADDRGDDSGVAGYTADRSGSPVRRRSLSDLDPRVVIARTHRPSPGAHEFSPWTPPLSDDR